VEKPRTTKMILTIRTTTTRETHPMIQGLFQAGRGLGLGEVARVIAADLLKENVVNLKPA
jgi:hypothetical protein